MYEYLCPPTVYVYINIFLSPPAVLRGAQAPHRRGGVFPGGEEAVLLGGGGMERGHDRQVGRDGGGWMICSDFFPILIYSIQFIPQTAYFTDAKLNPMQTQR